MLLEECFGEQHCKCRENYSEGSTRNLSHWQRKRNYLWAFAPRSPLRHDTFIGTQKRAGLGFWGHLILITEAVIHGSPFTISSVHTSVRQDHKTVWLLKAVQSTFKIVMMYYSYLLLKNKTSRESRRRISSSVRQPLLSDNSVQILLFNRARERNGDYRQLLSLSKSQSKDTYNVFIQVQHKVNFLFL